MKGSQKQKGNQGQWKKRSKVIALGVAAISLSQLLLYLGTRALESELEQAIVRPFQAE